LLLCGLGDFDGANRFVRLLLCIVERYSSVIEPRASARGVFVARRIMGRYHTLILDRAGFVYSSFFNGRGI
jgi:hypothetical protein